MTGCQSLSAWSSKRNDMTDVFITPEQAESDLLDCAAYLAERIRSSDGHAEAMKSVIPLYLEKGNVDLCAELANALEDPFSRDQLLMNVAVKCAELDDDEYALQLADAVEDEGIRAQALERIGVAAAEKGRTEQADNIAAMMSHPDFVQAGVAVRAAAAGRGGEASERLEEIEFPTARVNALQQMGAAKIDAGDAGAGIDYLDAAVDAAEGIEHDEEKIRTLLDIGNIFLDSKVPEKAVDTFVRARSAAEVLDNQHRDYFLVTCAIGFLNAGDVEAADGCLDLVRDKTQMASAMLGFARHYWAKEQKQDAIDALEEGYAILKSQRETETRDSRARNRLFTTVAAQFAGFGKYERAIEIAQENPDPDQQVSALGQIAQIMTAQGSHEQARETVNAIDSDADRVFTLIALSDAQNKFGDAETALTTLDEAAGMSDSVDQISARSEALNEIAGRYAVLGQAEKARAAALENLALIPQIRDESSRAAALAALSTVYEKAGLELRAEETELMRGLVRTVRT